MKFLASLLSILILVQCTFAPSASAFGSSYTPDDSPAEIKATAPVNKIGALLLADATVFLSNATLEVHGKGPDNADKTLLSGPVLNMQVTGTEPNRTIRGICYFTAGLSLNAICVKADHPDRVKTTDDQILEGTISGVGPDGLSVQTASGLQRVDSRRIRCVDSSCAFEFELTSDRHVKFGKCAMLTTQLKSQHQRNTARSPHSRAFKVTVVLLLAAGIATAIAVPVAVSGHHHHRNNGANALATQIYLQQRQGGMNSQVGSVLSNPFSNSRGFSGGSSGSGFGGGGSTGGSGT